MKALILHTTPPDDPGADRLRDEFDLREAAGNVAAALPGSTVCEVRGEAWEIVALIDRHAPEVVVNLCEAPLGRPELEPHAALLLELLGVRFTGCGSETLALCRRKDVVNPVLRDACVPVPMRVSLTHPSFPCIVKPSGEDGSAWMSHHSVCENAEELGRALAYAKAPVLVEEFLPGREFAVSLWGCAEPEHVSLGETVFMRGLRLITYAAKWEVESDDFADSPLVYDSEIAPELREAIVAAARGAWRAVGARQALRVDVRLDASGKPRVLDVNPNMEMSPEVGICRAVQEAGWSWRDFIASLVAWA
jgi:D-alanine-D-alanine ligase